MNITLRQLRYFMALAGHRHFGRAAAACNITQPALSLQLKELEAILGTPLVERKGGKVNLTDTGEAVLRRARSIWQSVEELEDFARASQDTLTGVLRMGMIPTVAPYMLPNMIGRFKKHYPGLELHVRETLTSKLIQELKDGRLDLALLALPVSEPALTEVALFEEPFLLVRPMHDRKKPAPAPHELRGMNLLLLEEGHCFREQALAFCKMPPPAGGNELNANTLATLVQMVAAGLGVTLLPEMAVKVESRLADVSIARLSGSQPTRTIGMAWRKGNPMGPRFEHLAKTVVKRP